MRIAKVTARLALAALGALGLSIIAFALLNAMPFWLMAAYDRQALDDAPAHGGALLFATVPLSLAAASVIFPLLTDFFFEWLSARRATTGDTESN
jgi:hypothetical protein